MFQITGTRFSVCVVLSEAEEYTSFAAQRDYPDRVYFHRTDLEKNPPNDVCNAYQRVSYRSIYPPLDPHHFLFMYLSVPTNSIKPISVWHKAIQPKKWRENFPAIKIN